MNLPLVYLDTNHLSRLVRYPAEPECVYLTRLFEQGEALLGFSVFGLSEVSHPNFKDAPAVGRFLDNPFVRWAVPMHRLFTEEIKSAVSHHLGVDRPPIVFHTSLAAAFGDPRLDRPASAFVQVLIENPSMRAGKDEAAHLAVGFDRLKRFAAVYRDPLEPLRGMIRDRGVNTTPAGLSLPVPLNPQDIIDSAGGLAGFPAYEVWNALHRDRLGDEVFQPDSNDIVDELHTIHAPYSTVIVLDKRTLGRFRNTQLPSVSRACRKLSEVEAMLAFHTAKAG